MYQGSSSSESDSDDSEFYDEDALYEQLNEEESSDVEYFKTNKYGEEFYIDIMPPFNRGPNVTPSDAYNELKTQLSGIKIPEQSSLLRPFSQHPHLGPGNKIQKVALTEIDNIARLHDIAYSNAKSYWDVKKADEKFMKDMSALKTNNITDWFAKRVGYYGIAAKYNFEKKFGLMYPVLTENERKLLEQDPRMKEYLNTTKLNRQLAAEIGLNTTRTVGTTDKNYYTNIKNSYKQIKNTTFMQWLGKKFTEKGLKTDMANSHDTSVAINTQNWEVWTASNKKDIKKINEAYWTELNNYLSQQLEAYSSATAPEIIENKRNFFNNFFNSSNLNDEGLIYDWTMKWLHNPPFDKQNNGENIYGAYLWGSNSLNKKYNDQMQTLKMYYKLKYDDINDNMSYIKQFQNENKQQSITSDNYEHSHVDQTLETQTRGNNN